MIALGLLKLITLIAWLFNSYDRQFALLKNMSQHEIADLHGITRYLKFCKAQLTACLGVE